MLRNYFKIAFRNITRHKAYSIINISGLAIGMASSILILLWVQNERSYDRFLKNADQIYRIVTDFGNTRQASNSAGMPAELKAKMPFIENTVRLSGISTVLFGTGDKKIEQPRVFYADPSFLNVFSFPLVKARTNTDLQNNVWDNFNFYNYIQLDRSFDPSAGNIKKLEQQLGQLFQPHSPGTKITFHLQPVTSIHLAPERTGDLPGHENAQYVGLSAFMAEQRTKEIGVRKVLGASVFNLVYLMSTGITRLVLLAICIAIPVSWYAADRWLAGFAYHIHVSCVIFLTASLAVLAIAWLTAGFESVKAAIVNPIKSLRTE